MAEYRRLSRWPRCRRETQPREAVSSPLPRFYGCRLNLNETGATRSLNRSRKTLQLRTLSSTSTTGSAPSSSVRITPLLPSAPESGFPFFRYRNSDSPILYRQTLLPVGMGFGLKTIMSRVGIVSALLPTTVLLPLSTSCACRLAHRDSGGKVTLAIFRCRKITIVAVNGHAVGVGFSGLQLPCDFRFIWAGAKLALPFVRRGITAEGMSLSFRTV